MRTLFLVAAFLLVSFGMLLAQPLSNSNAPHNRESESSFRGCLHEGHSSFTLISDSGRIYELVGDAAQLSKLAGNEVMISGQEGSASDIDTDTPPHSGLSTSNPTAGTAPTIKVMNVTKVSDHCGSK